MYSWFVHTIFWIHLKASWNFTTFTLPGTILLFTYCVGYTQHTTCILTAHYWPSVMALAGAFGAPREYEPGFHGVLLYELYEFFSL